MNSSVRVLQEEHQLLLLAITTAEQIQEISDNNLYYNKARNIILFFRQFTETYHYPKKYAALSPYLSKAGTYSSPAQKFQPNQHSEKIESSFTLINIALEKRDFLSLRTLMGKLLNEMCDLLESENQEVLGQSAQVVMEQEFFLA